VQNNNFIDKFDLKKIISIYAILTIILGFLYIQFESNAILILMTFFVGPIAFLSYGLGGIKAYLIGTSIILVLLLLGVKSKGNLLGKILFILGLGLYALCGFGIGLMLTTGV